MMPRVKVSNTSKIKSVVYNFSGEFMQKPNNELQYIATCATVWFPATNVFC